MNRNVRSTLLLAAPALAAAAVLPAAALSTIRPNAQPPTASTATSTRVHCGTVTGARWSLRNRYIHASGNRYVVSTEGGVSCSQARKWVPGLTRQANHGAGKAVKAPHGFKCTSSLPRAIGGKRVVAGGCLRRSTEFQWAPKSKLFSYS